MSAEKGRKTICQYTTCAPADAALNALDQLCCQGTLLTHIQFTSPSLQHL